MYLVDHSLYPSQFTEPRMSSTNEPNKSKRNDIPRFEMPMLLMQSVLVPSYSNSQVSVIAPIPVPTERISSSTNCTTKSCSIGTCRLPFNDQNVGKDRLPGYGATNGRRGSAQRQQHSNRATAATSQFEKDRSKENRSKLNQKLHAEHRVFMEGLKHDRETKFHTETHAAIVVQRYSRGLAARMKINPEKYSFMRTAMETKYSKKDLSKLVKEVIERSGIAL